MWCVCLCLTECPLAALGLIFAGKTREAVEILELMVSTYLIALCQAVDLRHLEENFHGGVKQTGCQAAGSVLSSTTNKGILLSSFRFCEKELLQVVVDRLPVFNYIEDPTYPSSPLMLQLRQVLLEHALNTNNEQSCLVKYLCLKKS